MFDKPQASHILSLEIEDTILKGVALTSVRGIPKLENFFSFPVESSKENENVKLLYNERDKKQLENASEKNLIITSISTQNTLIRPLELKLNKTKDIDAVLNFQAEPILPYPVDNAVLDRLILSQNKEGSLLTLAAARKDHITQHLEQWNTLDIEPEVISTAPFALSLFAKHFTSLTEALYVIYLGITHTFGILIDNGKLVAAQALPSDLQTLIQALSISKQTNKQDLLAQLNTNTISFNKDDKATKEALDTLSASTARTIYALTKQIKGREVQDILITGPGANIEGLAQELIQPLNKHLLTINPIPSFGMNEISLHSYALPIGSALSVLPIKNDQINFRQLDFAYPAPWKRLKKTMAIYLGLCLGLAIALILFGKAYSSYRETEIKKHYLELLNIMNKPYEDFEKEFSTKHPSNRDQYSETTLSIQELTTDDIRNRLNFLEQEIQATPQIYPLLPNTPLVSDVLAWISTHPNFIGISTDGSKTTSLQVENFSYTLVKRPDPTKKQERYQVKVELEFSSPTPKMAREFHDALITPNDIVDPKGEVKWNSARDRYRTSFFLKDKTVYPSL